MYFFPKLVSVGHFFLQNENYFVLFGEKEIDPTFVLIGSNIQHTCEYPAATFGQYILCFPY